jgi:hypothetical protein
VRDEAGKHPRETQHDEQEVAPGYRKRTAGARDCVGHALVLESRSIIAFRLRALRANSVRLALNACAQFVVCVRYCAPAPRSTGAFSLQKQLAPEAPAAVHTRLVCIVRKRPRL